MNWKVKTHHLNILKIRSIYHPSSCHCHTVEKGIFCVPSSVHTVLYYFMLCLTTKCFEIGLHMKTKIGDDYAAQHTYWKEATVILYDCNIIIMYSERNSVKQPNISIKTEIYILSTKIWLPIYILHSICSHIIDRHKCLHNIALTQHKNKWVTVGIM